MSTTQKSLELFSAGSPPPHPAAVHSTPASWGAFLPSPNSVPGLSLCALTCDGGGLIHSCSSPPWEVRSGCLSPPCLPEQKGTLSPETNTTAKSKDKVLARRLPS